LVTEEGAPSPGEGFGGHKDVIIRPPELGDRDGILAVVRDAFTSEERDATEELDIVLSTWRLRPEPSRLELVAVAHDAVVGHVLAASGSLGCRTVVAVAPLAVSPSAQGTGIGTSLMTRLLDQAEAEKLPLVVLLGLPAYYGRFGFEPSGPLGICYRPVGEENPHFLVRRLAGYTPSYRGDFTYCWEMEPA
jgi:putative acetyltransferase